MDYLKQGNKKSGEYTITDWQGSCRTVYCDMESEPGSAWTHVVSFSRNNKDIDAFRYKAFYLDAPFNELVPNWLNYRVSYKQMEDLKMRSTHWRATCSFVVHRGNNTDYVRAAFTEFDLMGRFWKECKKVAYINVMGQQCSNCSAMWW